MITCKHKNDGLCPACAKESPYTQFRYCRAACLLPTCSECGYFWGPGAPEALRGRPMFKRVDEEEGCVRG